MSQSKTVHAIVIVSREADGEGKEVSLHIEEYETAGHLLTNRSQATFCTVTVLPDLAD